VGCAAVHRLDPGQQFIDRKRLDEVVVGAVLEALDGKEGSDANKDGSVTMSELAEYVKSRVATLTNNKQSPNVRRVNLEADFALSKK
jgi:hypothetical protein